MAADNNLQPLRPGAEQPKPARKEYSAFAAATFQGPLPPPEAFAAFDRVLPGSADRILRMAESEQIHRQRQAEVNAAAFNKETHRGQWFAFLIAVATVISGATAGIMGAQWTGSFIGTGGLVGLVIAFIAGRRRATSAARH